MGNQINIQEFANILKCKVGKLPTVYLGLPLGASNRNKNLWEPVITKIQGRVGSWRNELLSKAGRLTLIKSVLSTMPTYFMSLFKMPCGIAKKINQILRKFYWNEEQQRRFIQLDGKVFLQAEKEDWGLRMFR